MQYKTTTPEDYILQATADRQHILHKLRNVIRLNLPKGFEEGIQYGMIGYYVPHSIYPKGYHCNPKISLPFMSFASQKNSINLYHSGIYASPELHSWFINAYPNYSKCKLDMGKSCIRFKKIDKIPFKLIAELCKKITTEEWISIYEASIKK
ncbi:DUF1801 domain-containing protein [Winogradskyella wichelsiae]|uniref:DUF1801 domain-containing protein n=1 Tax=Winogradskyella wichelsiae TaxID=2697007 RepID=UPI0015CD1A20|nr:DUF1801 domain-containing protein [Winogradskyella wichelsiae]